MKLSQIGEFGLIELLKKAESGKQKADTVIGIGDDAAVMQIPNSKFQIPNKSKISKSKHQRYFLVTTDTLIENIHFKLKNTSFFDLGYKALAVNISDIAAMGGWPTHALVTIGLPKKVLVEQVRQFYAGINSLAKRHGIDIIGGDTVASPKEIVVSITLLGEVEKENLLTRSGAKVGDAILATGEFGKPAALKFDSRKLKVVSRTREARKIAKSWMATSMIDSSDGLVRSVIEICRMSKVGARIWLDSVPIAKGANLDQALYGGEEYELVFTVPKEKAVKVVGWLGRACRQAGGLVKMKVSIVGEIVSKKRGVKLVDVHGKVYLPKSGGYEHFK